MQTTYIFVTLLTCFSFVCFNGPNLIIPIDSPSESIMKFERRTFLKSGVYSGLGWSFSSLLSAKAPQNNHHLNSEENKDFANALTVPPGFSVKVINRTGQVMTDGLLVPGKPDGMACVDANGRLALFRNHEISNTFDEVGAFDQSKDQHQYKKYDSYKGGVSKLILNPNTYEVEESYLVLAGSSRNCAGGLSPWGWMSCEEDTSNGRGYVYLCPFEYNDYQHTRKIPSYGRFNHEACIVHPETYNAYLTEDRWDGCFYRFKPYSKGDPFVGTLQALKVEPSFISGQELTKGKSYKISWVDLISPNYTRDDLRIQAQKLGATKFIRGEGLWLDGDKIYFSATQGGSIYKGQIFMLEGDQLTLLAESMDYKTLNMPDNITVSPWGQLVLVEDSSGYDHIRWLDRNGQVKTFGKNILSKSEMTGVCFDPSGKAMFLNIQEDGLTLAITGDFDAYFNS